jgi:hypothetical protein
MLHDLGQQWQQRNRPVAVVVGAIASFVHRHHLSNLPGGRKNTSAYGHVEYVSQRLLDGRQRHLQQPQCNLVHGTGGWRRNLRFWETMDLTLCLTCMLCWDIGVVCHLAPCHAIPLREVRPDSLYKERVFTAGKGTCGTEKNLS